ncbi:hypothetical protein, partial [Fibrobacter sp.]|uniref:hypothetical protein n=1 Tax=Fibrobacter sp. TaxID=35828 RepID=UPI002605A494
RLLAGFISLLFILVPLDVEFSFFSTKEPRFYRLKISDRLIIDDSRFLNRHDFDKLFGVVEKFSIGLIEG